ncbi:MAG: hydrogenase maturation nickel metallochaperone HypA [Spirochaetes bacterium]|nr:hydrogenase maturation nickel metallochaperone HypA [Spirochaetota bacterium]
MEKILTIVLESARKNKVKKVISITLEIGALSDFQEIWMEKYYKILAAGTAAEGSVIKIIRQKGEFRCTSCGKFFHDDFSVAKEAACPDCSGKLNFSGTSDYFIKEMEVL